MDNMIANTQKIQKKIQLLELTSDCGKDAGKKGNMKKSSAKTESRFLKCYYL